MALAKKPAEIVAESKSALLAKHESWERVAVSDVAEILNGYAFKSDRFTNDKGTPLIRIRDVGKDRTNTYFDGEYDEAYLVKKGDLLIGMDGDFRCSIWRGEDALLNQRVCKITLKTNAYDFGFLSYVLQPYLDAIHAETSAVTVKHLSSKSISEIPLPLPPVEQQKRIVAKIEELFSHIDAGIAALNKAKQLLKQYRQSVLKAAVTGELTKQWREDNKDKLEPASQLLGRILQERRQNWELQQLEQFKAKGKVPKNDKWKEKYKEPEDVVADDLPDTPEEWVWVRLDSIANVGSGMSVSKSRKLADPVDVAYLRVANVQRGFLLLDEIKTMPIEKAKLVDLKLKEWDVLYNEGGDIDKLGRGWIWENQVEPCITQNHVFRASPYIRSRNHSAFLSLWGNTFGKEYFINTGKQTTNLASINKGVLSAFPTPLPPLEEQEKVIELVEEKQAAIDRLASEVNVQLAKADKNKQSVLVSAFSGSLVGALDSDGSAVDLLDEIERQRGLGATRKKLNREQAAEKKGEFVAKKKIIDILKASDKPLSPEKLFDLIEADGSSPDEVEEFYIELKEALSDMNVLVEALFDNDIKQGDLISYKAKA